MTPEQREKRREYQRAYYAANAEKLRQYQREYRASHLEERRQYDRDHRPPKEKKRQYDRDNYTAHREERCAKNRSRYSANREKILERQRASRAAKVATQEQREKKREWARSYYTARPEKRRERHRAYYAANRLACVLRVRHRQALKGGYATAGSSAVCDIGCTWDELRAHLEARFLPGMSWENWSRSGWHVDHIIPLSSFDLSDREQRQRAFHYTNLQPLWAADNLSKGAKIECP